MSVFASYVPELAGLCSYDDAAHVGFSVDESVRRLVRLHWTEKRLMEVALAHLASTPEWEVKCGLALHQWQDAEHTDAIRRRISEMRSPPPRLDASPDARLQTCFDDLLRAQDTVELIAGLTFVRTALVEAYRHHLEGSNALVDHPTRRVLRFNLVEEEEELSWCERALAALVRRNAEARDRATAWQTHLRALLAAAGGIAGDEPVPPEENTPQPRTTEPYVADTTPQRDTRFRGVREFDFPPQVVYNMDGVPADERNLALLCRRALEMDVPETMASFMTERRDRPWDYYHDYARQLWDEARHAMMGSVGLSARGIDWTAIPLHVGFSLRLNRHAEPLERQILLFAIEQSLMPADTGKRFEHETALEAGDALSAHFHDFDWADEVLHAQIGRRWLKDEGISVQDAIRRGEGIHERTWPELARYQEPLGEDPWTWWRQLVCDVLGKESAARKPDADRPTIVGSDRFAQSG